ncbi:MAG: hypothetical protein BGO67_09270 [Alphaproteobacteria bacterium 41-28]|nr:MAG: hypothetical protein BGO67_09270 [Alphaproteobacteria bacterium 41-28]
MRGVFERENVLYPYFNCVKLFRQNLLIIHNFLTQNNLKSWFASVCFPFLSSRHAVSWSRKGKRFKGSYHGF